MLKYCHMEAVLTFFNKKVWAAARFIATPPTQNLVFFFFPSPWGGRDGGAHLCAEYQTNGTPHLQRSPSHIRATRAPQSLFTALFARPHPCRPFLLHGISSSLLLCDAASLITAAGQLNSREKHGLGRWNYPIFFFGLYNTTRQQPVPAQT